MSGRRTRVLVASVLCLSLARCAGAETEQAPPSVPAGPPTDQAPPVVGIAPTGEIDAEPTWAWEVRDGFSAGAPVIEDGLVVATAGPHELVALDVATGALRWAADVGAHLWTGLRRPAWSGTTVVAVVENDSGGGGLAAVDARDGRVLWAVDLGLVGAVTPGVDPAAGVVVVGDLDGAIVAVAVGDGSTKWDHRATGPVEGVAARPGGFVVTVGAPDPALVAFDASGRVEWWAPLPKGPTSAPAVVAGAWGEDVVVVDGSAELRAHDAATGTQRWTATVGSAGSPSVPPSLASDGVHIVAAGGLGHRVLVDGATGHAVWRGVDVWAPWLAGPVAIVDEAGATTVVLPIDAGSAVIGGLGQADHLLATPARLSGVVAGATGPGRRLLVAAERGEAVNRIVAWNVGARP